MKKGIKAKDLAQLLGVSPSTVSRLLTKSRDQGIISFVLNEPFADCLQIADQITRHYDLKETIVIPVYGQPDASAARRAVALEGARYLQRIIKR